MAYFEKMQKFVGMRSGRISAFVVLLVLAWSVGPVLHGQSVKEPTAMIHPGDPWTPQQIVTVKDLRAELASPNPPMVIQVGIATLYRNGHIPGAVYFGPASKPDALNRLRQELKDLPRDRSIVFYCGCCPFGYCPNVRPAFKLARDMGFTRIKVLYLPNDLGQDWVQPGYPVEKGNTN